MDVLFNSTSLTDFISNYYIISEIASYDSELIDNIECKDLFKLTNIKVPIYLLGDTYYLNSNYIDKIDNHLVIFMCLSLFCGDINPLKFGLICLEIEKLFNFNKSYKELKIARILKEKVLEDIPFNIIFLDSDIEIFNYLSEEKGIEIANFYYQVSNLMKAKYNDFNFDKFNFDEFNNFYENINYEDILDIVYSFIHHNVR